MTEQKPRWAAFWAAWVGWVLDAFDFTIYIVVAQHLIKEFGVSPTAIGGSLTLTLLVRLVGGFVAGWMADRWGRKLPLMLSLVWFAVFDAAIYFAPSWVAVVVLRTIFGFGMGAEWTAGTAMAMENWPARSRRLASGLLQAGWPIGFLLAALTAYFVVHACPTSRCQASTSTVTLTLPGSRPCGRRRCRACGPAPTAARCT